MLPNLFGGTLVGKRWSNPFVETLVDLDSDFLPELISWLPHPGEILKHPTNPGCFCLLPWLPRINKITPNQHIFKLAGVNFHTMWLIYYGVKWVHIGDLNSQHSNCKIIWMSNLDLFGIQMLTNWMVWTFWLATTVKSLVTKCHSVTNFLPFE